MLEDFMCDTIGQRFHVLGHFFNNAAIFDLEILNAFQLNGGPVDVKNAVFDLNAIFRQADDPLDIVYGRVLWEPEDSDLSPLGFLAEEAAGEQFGAKGKGKVCDSILELAHKQKVTNVVRGVHGARRDFIGLKNEGSNGENNEQDGNERFDDLLRTFFVCVPFVGNLRHIFFIFLFGKKTQRGLADIITHA